ncbi:MAG: NAD(+)/NADH kinase [Deltaproteobacteria bacterium]|nr:NAD(+)/NADH kinase [Deltaproteobacteria bacterium]
MRLRRVLLTFKISLFENTGAQRSDRRLMALIRAADPMVAKVRSSHEETARSREIVKETLAAGGLKVVQVRRLRPVSDDRYDLVVVVGGDGTVLDVARFVKSIPILAVNSSPSTSVGHFCCTTAGSLGDMLKQVKEGAARATALNRIRVAVDGKDHRYPALNDVLLAHRVPAATSRYVIHVGNAEEEQKSSGVWIATAAGSTGGIRSAGGAEMDASDHALQYLVREPFIQSNPVGRPYGLQQGKVGPEGLAFTSRMIRGGMYLDGRRVAVPVEYGSRITFTPDAAPLNIFLPEWKR